MVKAPAPLAALLLVAIAGCGDDEESGGRGGDRTAIVVASPKPGQDVSSPVRISGTASVFEGTVQLSVLDADGDEVGRGFTTATAGAPDRGTFSKRLEFTVGKAQEGAVEVFEQNAASPGESADRRLFTVTVPVRLEP